MLPWLKNIAKKRRILNLTQKELAGLAGVSQSLIAKLELGQIEAIVNKLGGMENAADFLAGYLSIERKTLSSSGSFRSDT